MVDLHLLIRHGGSVFWTIITPAAYVTHYPDTFVGLFLLDLPIVVELYSFVQVWVQGYGRSGLLVEVLEEKILFKFRINLYNFITFEDHNAFVKFIENGLEFVALLNSLFDLGVYLFVQPLLDVDEDLETDHAEYHIAPVGGLGDFFNASVSIDHADVSHQSQSDRDDGCPSVEAVNCQHDVHDGAHTLKIGQAAPVSRAHGFFPLL